MAVRINASILHSIKIVLSLVLVKTYGRALKCLNREHSKNGKVHFLPVLKLYCQK